MAAAPAALERPVCAICTDVILPVAVVSRLNCNHEYHQECLQPWLIQHNTCPLDRGRITSINGQAIERPEVSGQPAIEEHILDFYDPLAAARSLYREHLRVIQNPSISSADPLERMAAKTQAVFFSIFGGPSAFSGQRHQS